MCLGVCLEVWVKSAAPWECVVIHPGNAWVHEPTHENCSVHGHGVHDFSIVLAPESVLCGFVVIPIFGNALNLFCFPDRAIVREPFRVPRSRTVTNIYEHALHLVPAVPLYISHIAPNLFLIASPTSTLALLQAPHRSILYPPGQMS